LILTLVGSLFSLVLPAVQPSYASHENITVNVSGDAITKTYEEDEEVAIEGVIEDVVDNEQVIISIGEPGDSTPDEVQSDEPSSNGNFDYLYEIPSSPEEGVYTVEVEYDDEFAYTYFIVDEDDDTITIELIDHEDGIFEAGDEVEIAGSVDQDDLGEEDNVQITVLDPFNEPVVDDEDAELGDGDLSNDEFEFSFDLDNDAPHGRYAVIVTYDVENQEGSTLFEIEDTEEDDDDSSSADGDSDSDGDLSAEILEATYAPGDTVTVEGEIDDYDETDNIDLEIVIEDPDGEEIDSDDSVNVDEDDGTFSYDYDLEDDAEEGSYAVTIAYDDLEVELEFEVEEEGSGGGTGSSDITIRLNKGSFLAGETMTVSGTVEDVADPDDGEQVSVFAYRPTGQVILAAGSSKYVTPSSNGAYSATIVLPSNLEADEDYKVVASYLGDQAEVSFDITGVSSAPSDEITVETDEDEYSIGSTVEISGEVPDALLVEDQQLLIRINKPDGSPCRIDPIDLPASGSYTYELTLGGVCGISGEYEVEVAYGAQKGKTTFELVGGASKYPISGEGYSFEIEYEISNGAIKSMFVRPGENKLVITLDANEDGQLTVVLPREVIDAIENGEDIDYVVTVEDESGDVSSADIEESENNDDARTLVIDYEAGTGRIEIAGTRVVPEFGAIAAIVMAIAIVGIIVATTRYNKFNFFRQ
jgi:predicted secreted protein with PEFG-CTERM motif